MRVGVCVCVSEEVIVSSGEGERWRDAAAGVLAWLVCVEAVGWRGW